MDNMRLARYVKNAGSEGFPQLSFPCSLPPFLAQQVLSYQLPPVITLVSYLVNFLDS